MESVAMRRIINQRTVPALATSSPFLQRRHKDTNLASRIRDKLLARLDPQMDISDTDLVRRTITELFPAALEEENLVLSRAERAHLLEEVIAEILGYGPIEALLQDNSITEIMVNGPKNIYVERHGKIEKTNLSFEDDVLSLL